MKTVQIIAGALVLVATLIGTSHGAPAMTPTEQCEYYGRIADMASTLRDQGVPSNAVVDYFRSQIRQATAPGITPAGRETFDGMMTTIVLNVYAHPGVSPSQAKLATFNVCLNTRGR